MKKFLYIAALILNLFIINNKVFAFESDYILTEEDVYTLVEKQSINLESNPNIFCYLQSPRIQCFFFNDTVLNNTTITKNYSGYTIENKIDTSLNRHYFSSLNSINIMNGVKLYFSFTSSDVIFTNIEDVYSIEGYDNIHKLNIPEEPAEPEQPIVPEQEINKKATNLLNFLIDKTKNIYEILISNEIFKFILSIPLIYLVFLALSRIIKK